MTPAQEAKQYAADNGFTISPNGRRYTVSYPEAQHDTFVADVGGYPAALNAMRKYVDALKTDAAITDLARIVDPATLLQPIDIAHGNDATSVFVTIGTDAGWQVKTVDEIHADIVSCLAKTIRKQRGKRASQPMTHIVVMRFKSGTRELAYPSRREAVKGVRQVLSGLQKRYHPSFVTIQPIGA